MVITLTPPQEFSYALCLDFLKRSPRELLHVVEENTVIKALRLGKEHEHVLFKINHHQNQLMVEILTDHFSHEHTESIAHYVNEWFDLKTDLLPFYQLAAEDDLLKELIKKFYGYRIVGQPDLFESLIWAVLGQQINLGFAYTLKQRFVEKFGEAVTQNGITCYLFPTPERVAVLTDEDLLPLQFSKQKSKYTLGIARAFVEGRIQQQMFTGLSLTDAKEKLMSINGVGNWTANYALMKTFHYPDAFPLEDAGLHNAIKNQLGLTKKPSLQFVKMLFEKYKGWEAYATLYLWKSL
jgi:DNA-3-methyladenine glycosylase II